MTYLQTIKNIYKEMIFYVHIDIKIMYAQIISFLAICNQLHASVSKTSGFNALLKIPINMLMELTKHFRKRISESLLNVLKGI